MFTGLHTGDYSINLDRRMGPIEIERSTGKWRCGNTESAPSCPRCASSNTKFCYYNNYSLSQPRYFCKGCRRYWTKGGSLRNVPVGGGCRKSRRSRSARNGGAGAASSRLTQGVSGGGADIDLAAVFAKYVGENEESSCSPGGSSGSSENIPAPEIDDLAMFPYQFQYPCQSQKQPSDLINGGEEHDQLQQVPEFPMEDDAINGHDLVGGGFDQLQPGAMLADELGVFSSEGTNLPDFECQQMQDFSIFDEFENNNYNLSCDSNWGFFDFSAYEYFSRP